MSIISKLKGDKKTESGKKDGEKNNQAGQDQSETPPRKTWAPSDMRQVNRITERIEADRSRPSSIRSSRSSRPHTKRSSGGQGSSASSVRLSKNNSFLGLERVMEDGDGDSSLDPYAIPPMPPIPSKYSSASLASTSRPGLSRSPFSASSTTSKSGLSSVENSSPIDSEESSNSSNCSNDVLEMRSHPYSRPEQFVFGQTKDGTIMNTNYIGKGKVPMYASYVVEEPRKELRIQSMPERKYFTQSTPTGAAVSEFANVARSPPKKVEAPKGNSPPAVKKNRFSLFKKSEVAV